MWRNESATQHREATQPKYRNATSICPRFDAQISRTGGAATSNTRLGGHARSHSHKNNTKCLQYCRTK